MWANYFWNPCNWWLSLVQLFVQSWAEWRLGAEQHHLSSQEGRLVQGIDSIPGVTDEARKAFVWFFGQGWKMQHFRSLLLYWVFIVYAVYWNVAWIPQNWVVVVMLWRSTFGWWQWFFQTPEKLLCSGAAQLEYLAPDWLIVEGALPMSGMRRSSCAELNWIDNQGAEIVEQHKCSAFPLVPKQSQCCYENVLWKTFHLELKSHLCLPRTCSWTEFYFLSKWDFLVLEAVEITAPPICSPPALRGLGASGEFWQRRWFVQQEQCRAWVGHWAAQLSQN